MKLEVEDNKITLDNTFPRVIEYNWQDAAIYHWNPLGTFSKWDLPQGWENLSTVEVNIWYTESYFTKKYFCK